MVKESADSDATLEAILGALPVPAYTIFAGSSPGRTMLPEPLAATSLEPITARPSLPRSSPGHGRRGRL